MVRCAIRISDWVVMSFDRLAGRCVIAEPPIPDERPNFHSRLKALDGFMLTAVGTQAARTLPTGIDSARAALTEETQRALLDVLLAATENGGHSRESAAQALGIHPNGGRYGSNLLRLREMGLIPERGSLLLTKGAFQ